MIFNLFAKKETKQERVADQLYNIIVKQAREPIFYLDYKIPDSVNGRFELILLHNYLLFYRLREEDEQVREYGQAVFDRFFKDMDHSLREIGIGDLSVPKKIKKMAQAFYGRVEAYDTGREEGREQLASALSRNFFPEEEGEQPEALGLADYLIASTDFLAEQQADKICEGELQFAPIPPFKA